MGDMEREKLKLHPRLRLLQMPLVAMVDMVALMAAMEDTDMEREKLKLQLLLTLLQMPLMGMEDIADMEVMEVMGDTVTRMEVMEDTEDMVALMVAMEDMDMENKTEPRILLQTDVKRN